MTASPDDRPPRRLTPVQFVMKRCRELQLPPTVRLVALVGAQRMYPSRDHPEDNDVSFGSYEGLAAETGLSRASVARAVKRLREVGLFTTRCGGQRVKGRSVPPLLGVSAEQGAGAVAR